MSQPQPETTAVVVDLNRYRTQQMHTRLDMRTCEECGGYWFFSTIALDLDGDVSGRRLGIICVNCGKEQDV